jgi:hypothetical protein
MHIFLYGQGFLVSMVKTCSVMEAFGDFMTAGMAGMHGKIARNERNNANVRSFAVIVRSFGKVVQRFCVLVRRLAVNVRTKF